MRILVALVAVGGLLVADARATPPAGKVLYERYCASCHGTGGHGDGPVASGLKTPPTDLTRTDATVPALMEWIDGRRTVREHGTAQMPVWGTVLEGARAGEPHKGRATLLEVRELAEYVHSLQSRR